MDTYSIQPDPCDNALVRFSNAMQFLACICDLASIFSDAFRDCRRCVRCSSDLIFLCTLGCMYAQLRTEVSIREESTREERTQVVLATYAPPRKLGGSRARGTKEVGALGSAHASARAATEADSPPTPSSVDV